MRNPEQFNKSDENAKNEDKPIKLTPEQRKQQTETKINQIKLLIEMLKGSINNYKPSMQKGKYVLMLDRSLFHLDFDKDEGEYFYSPTVKPKLYSATKAKKLKQQAKLPPRESLKMITKRKFLLARLKAAEGLLNLLDEAKEIDAVKKK